MTPKPKQWTSSPQPEAAALGQLRAAIAAGDSAPPPNSILSLLLRRGIHSLADFELFFHPTWSRLHDPMTLLGMDVALDRIDAALSNGQQILIYGDYDVDGTSAVALLCDFLAGIGHPMPFYIPKRETDGYGLSLGAVRRAAENNIKLIITVDCGITAHDAVDLANELGVDVIITDHHRPAQTLPNAYAVVNPRQDGCPYPFKDLSGCGLAFKITQAYCRRHHLDEERLKPLTDLVAVSIAADIVPVIGENRILAREGLDWLNNKPRAGFKAIINRLHRKRPIALSDIVFTIAPRINAAGRMDNAEAAVDLLISRDQAKADAIAEMIDETNTKRKSVDSEITNEAIDLVRAIPNFDRRKSTVVFKRNWHKGVIGIVASRLVDYYYRPTVVLSENDGKFTGSARSVKGFDIYNAIAECSDLLEQFGGHKYAAGLTLKTENVEAFAELFEAVVARSCAEHLLTPQMSIEAEIQLKDVNDEFFSWLKRFAPFGPGNPQPQFMSRGVFADMSHLRILGDHHLQLPLIQEGGPRFQAVAFNMADAASRIRKGIPFDVVYTIDEDNWRDQTQLKLYIKDIRF